MMADLGTENRLRGGVFWERFVVCYVAFISRLLLFGLDFESLGVVSLFLILREFQ